eukprot:2921640-Pleurochrysis_carterae.AAC.1
MPCYWLIGSVLSSRFVCLGRLSCAGHAFAQGQPALFRRVPKGLQRARRRTERAQQGEESRDDLAGAAAPRRGLRAAAHRTALRRRALHRAEADRTLQR